MKLAAFKMTKSPAYENAPMQFWKSCLIGAAIITLTFAVYFPALNAPFIWDDALVLTDNPIVTTRNGLYYAWFSTAHGDYIPLTLTSFWFEWRLWGANPVGYRIDNVLLHGISAILIWRILRGMKVPGAFFAALIFAVHPVCVTSVAWIAERKNTLSLLFYALSILFFLKNEAPTSVVPNQQRNSHDSARQPSRFTFHVSRWYYLSLFSFLLALASKPSVVVLPAVILLLIWWMRGRVGADDFKKVLPFFVLTLISSVMAIWVQDRALASELSHTDSVLTRLIGGTWALWFYLWKAVMPVGLSIVYPRWEIVPGAVVSWIPGVLLVAGAVVLIRSAHVLRRTPARAALFALAYFVIALSPVLGLFDIIYFAFSRVGDHLQYIGIIGVAALLAAALHRLGKRSVPLSVVVVLIFSILGWQRATVFSSPEKLWRDALHKNPDSYPVHYNLGSVLDDAGKLDEAIVHFQRAIEINPRGVNALNNLGYALHRQGDIGAAETNYVAALRVDPNFADAHANLGAILLQRGELDRAIVHLKQAIEGRSMFAEAHYNLARALMIRGKFDEALLHLQAAVDSRPDFEDARKVLAGLNSLRELWNGFSAEVLNENAIRMAQQKQFFEALFILDLALKTGANAETTHRNIASVYMLIGRKDYAIAHNRLALRENPDLLGALNNLAWLLATQTNSTSQEIQEALSFSQRAVDFSREGDPQYLDTLAVCQAAAGHFEKALEVAAKGHSLATAAGQTNLASKFEKRMASFRAREAIRE